MLCCVSLLGIKETLIKQGEDNSPASFERALETLSGKITRANTRLDTHRQNARRFKALWTLYTTFAYLLYSIILALVLGWQNFGVVEYAAIAGGPVVYAKPLNNPETPLFNGLIWEQDLRRSHRRQQVLRIPHQ